MKSRKRYSAVLAGIFFFVSASFSGVRAQSLPLGNIPNATDPTKADILSLHLYMTSKEVIAILEKEFHVKFSPTCSLIGGQRNCFITNNTNLTPGKRFVSSIEMGNAQ